MNILSAIVCRNFEKKNLGQIKFVYPEAFIFRQQKNIPGTIDKSEFSQYQLIVECTANEGENGGMVKKVPVGKRLEPTAFVKRKNKFNENLLNIVINHHKVSLISRSVLQQLMTLCQPLALLMSQNNYSH